MAQTSKKVEKIKKAEAKKEKKLRKKLLKKRDKHLRKSLIKDVLGDFSVQTGSYF